MNDASAIFDGPFAFTRWLALRPGMTVCIMGAGGKHTLMARLERELTSQRIPVLLTSTTNLHHPGESAERSLSLMEEGRGVVEQATTLPAGRALYVLRREFAPGILQGLTVEEVGRLRELHPEAVFVVKTDGARKRSLKAPAADEPVLPDTCDVCVVLAGIDCVGRPLDAGTVHRYERVAESLGVPEGTVLTASMVGRVLAHPESYPSRLPKQARRIVYLSKVTAASEGVAVDVLRAIPRALYDARASGDTVEGKVTVWG